MISHKCNTILRKYKNKYIAQTITHHDILEKMLIRLDNVEDNIQEVLNRLDKIEKFIQKKYKYQ
jgi:hypothetical protein